MKDGVIVYKPLLGATPEQSKQPATNWFQPFPRAWSPRPMGDVLPPPPPPLGFLLLLGESDSQGIHGATHS